MPSHTAALRFFVLAAAAGCAAAPAATRTGFPFRPIVETTQAAGHPPVAVLAREGDPSAAVALAVLTEGIEPTGGAAVPVALAAVMEARLAAAGIGEASVVPSADGFRVRALAPTRARGKEVISAIKGALFAPVTATGPEMAAVARKLGALAQLPIADPALEAAVRCAGEPFAIPSKGGSEPGSPVPAPTVEAWRAASAGLGRVVFGAVGSTDDALALAGSVSGGPVWPSALPIGVSRAHESMPDAVRVYDATPDLPAGAARLTLTLQTVNAERAAAAAELLGQPRGALLARLGALEPSARVRGVTATAHVGGGCLVVTVDLPAPAATTDPPTALTTAVNIVREQMLIDVADAKISGASARALANRAGDPRDAAELAAFWTLILGAATAPPKAEPGEPVAVAVGLGIGAAGDSLAERVSAIHAELDHLATAQGGQSVEARTRVERGQPELWVLLASPCGTDIETETDAGTGAMAAIAAADRARDETWGSNAYIEGWADPEGIGVLAHAAGMPGETSDALARRVARLAARSFVASALEPSDIARARGRLLSTGASGDDARGFAILADAVAPRRPSWIMPFGTRESLERSSDATVRARFDALRGGPLRVAIVANQEASQFDVAVRTIEQWTARRTDLSRACPPRANPSPPRAGTYAVEQAGAPSADAWLAFALPSLDVASRAAASAVAAALDGKGGLLEKALGAGLAREWTARVIGPARASALVVRVSSAQGTLDAAVAETRALFDRVRLGALNDADRARALSRLADARLATSLDPKARVIALWRGEAPALADPSLESIRAFTHLNLKDDALIIVAARPPRLPSAKAP